VKPPFTAARLPTLASRVWYKEDAGVIEMEAIRYGIAHTLQSETAFPVYDQIQERLRVKPQPGA
jgi:hypothetical protein